MLTSLYTIIRSRDFLHPTAAPLLALSITLFLAFGSNFRRVRRQEARALLMIFAAVLQSSKCRPETESDKTVKSASSSA